MANGESSSPPPDDFNISEADNYGRTSKRAKAELSDPARLAYWREQYAEYKKLANKNLNRANLRFFGEDSTAAAQGKYYTTLRGFIIAQLRKETE